MMQERRKQKASKGRRICRTILILIVILLAVAAGYVIYAFAAYDRLEDHMELTVYRQIHAKPAADQKLRVLSYNIGFGAYSDDYSFFMDGGEESRARSPEAVRQNIAGALDAVTEYNPDLVLLQEVDFDSTRSHHIDQRQLVADRMREYACVFAQNYDSPYLMWPIHAPHGANKAGMMTLSRYGIASALRRSLPIEEGPMMMVDLDRCYSVSRIPTANGKEIALYNFHLSAYTSDGTIAQEQLALLFQDMEAERERGNYVIAGGDFNKDLLGNSGEVFGVCCDGANWAQPIPEEMIPDGFRIEAPFDCREKIPSCRNADRPYGSDSFVLTIDGFILSDNVETVESAVADTQFRWSDHNPVWVTVRLK